MTTQPHYDIDGVTLYHGDCVDVLPAAGVKANLILTSPPYDNLRTYGGHGFDFDSVADACVGALSDGGVLVWVVADATVDGSETGTSFRQALGFMERGLRLHDTMIYQKSGGFPTKNEPRYRRAFEYMFVFSNGKPVSVNLIADQPSAYAGTVVKPKVRQSNGSTKSGPAYTIPDYITRTSVWSYSVGYGKAHNGDMSIHQHPATFPLALAKDHILTWTNHGDVVLDPMAGSGTTLRAAKDLGRTAIGVEIHADYLPIITGRMAQGVLV